MIHCALVLVDFEVTLKFQLLENFMHKDLIPYIEANNVQIFEAPLVEACRYDQIFAFDFTYIR